MDVQNALEMLTNGAGGPCTERDRDSHRRADDYADDDPPPTPPPPFRTDTLAAPSPDTPVQIQEQADKLIAHASEIGVSVFNPTNAFWKERKERVRWEAEVDAGWRPG